MNNHEIALSVISELSESEKNNFRSLKRESLIRVNPEFCRWIRNEFKLWSVPWEPELIDGIDYSKDHPDNRTAEIIEIVWLYLNGKL